MLPYLTITARHSQTYQHECKHLHVQRGLHKAITYCSAYVPNLPCHSLSMLFCFYIIHWLTHYLPVCNNNDMGICHAQGTDYANSVQVLCGSDDFEVSFTLSSFNYLIHLFPHPFVHKFTDKTVDMRTLYISDCITRNWSSNGESCSHEERNRE